MNRKVKAFTLIELMIVVAIVAIIAAIGYPSYQTYVVRSKEADATAALMNAAQAMERYKVNNYTYELPSSGTDLSAVFATQVPVDGGDAYYNLTVASTATTYTITATPTGSMSGKGSTLTISQDGSRTGW
ncbi:type IV pilin protein [Aliikangiella sp. G2MR2-5]|uniref:type IV pilin protein n=1 Tax=Aliikangiella sp. G2MR2-5 TaxID=2788943 RepID=UPI0018A9F755|nr:type IV pilin protein [Aliikangiella sp. G2MR2-5]